MGDLAGLHGVLFIIYGYFLRSLYSRASVLFSYLLIVYGCDLFRLDDQGSLLSHVGRFLQGDGTLVLVFQLSALYGSHFGRDSRFLIRVVYHGSYFGRLHFQGFFHANLSRSGLFLYEDGYRYGLKGFLLYYYQIRCRLSIGGSGLYYESQSIGQGVEGAYYGYYARRDYGLQAAVLVCEGGRIFGYCIVSVVLQRREARQAVSSAIYRSHVLEYFALSLVGSSQSLSCDMRSLVVLCTR